MAVVVIVTPGQDTALTVRNTLAGLDAVPPDVLDAARGMGMGPIRMFARVEVPLAMPAILAGFRVATVSTVVALPAPCFAPAVFFVGVLPSGAERWFAVTGF